MNSKILGIVFITTIFLFGISFVLVEIGDSTIETFEIESSQVECTGVGPQKCLIVNGQLFYDGIEGFDYEEGYEYKLRVNKTQIYDETNAPADTSIYKYILVEIISKQKVSDSDVEEIVGNEVLILSSSSILTNKYYVEFDDAKTYTIWLYTEEEPTREQVQSFITALGTKFSSEIPEFYFNFNIFPKDSTKIPGDTQIYDTYANVVWRNNEVVFPVDTQPSIICGDGVCDSLETPDDCSQDCYTGPIEEKPNDLIYWISGIVIIILVTLFLILRKKK